MSQKKPVAIVLGPSRCAVSGVSTHLNVIFGSLLTRDFALIHFQVGSEGRSENAASRWWRLLSSPFLLAARILLSGADIVHINTSLNRRAYWRDFAYLVAAKLCRTRVVFQVHGGPLPRQFAADQHLPESLLRTMLALPDAIVVLARDKLAAFRNLMPKKSVVVLPNGIDVTLYRSASRPPANRLTPLHLVYIGRVANEKGLDETLHGLALAHAQGIAATLIVAGSGPEEHRLLVLAQQLNLADAVRFVGPVFDAEKRRLLGTADVLMLPSYSEGLPYALLESMAAGVPAITTRVGAIPDVVIDGVHSLFVPPRNPQAICRALVRLTRNRDLLARMAIAGQQRAAHYSVERLANDLGNLYRAVCGGPRADVPEYS